MKFNVNFKPELLAFLAAIRVFCIIIAAVMAKEGWDHTGIYHMLMLVSGSVIAVGTGAYGVYATFVNLWKAAALGTQAGVNLAVSGKAVDSGGNVISMFSDRDSTPPKPVTVESAKEIVKDFGPIAAVKAA